MRIESICVIGGKEEIGYRIGDTYPFDDKKLIVTEIKHIDISEYVVIFDDNSEVRIFSDNVILYAVPESSE